jgi:hypothetical protein
MNATATITPARTASAERSAPRPRTVAPIAPIIASTRALFSNINHSGRLVTIIPATATGATIRATIRTMRSDPRQPPPSRLSPIQAPAGRIA